MSSPSLQYDFPEISKDEKFILFDKLNSEDTKKMNFDQYRKKVYNDLNNIESEIIKNLSKNDKEFMEMFKNFEESEEILDKLEGNLLFYKNKLNDINNDMKVLQNKSNEITLKLKNRKEFEEELFTLLDSIILAPDFLNDILCKDINDEFVGKINILEKKLQTFIGGDLPESSAINEIIPELQKTLAKVCSKIYSHIVNSFLMLNKPGTNIQIIQRNVFLKMKELVVFLKKHAPSMYTELISKYVSFMEKIYANSTTKYTQELLKLVFNRADKFSLTQSEELSKDMLILVEKRKTDILKGIDKESIIPMYALVKKETYYNEQLFQSLNKFIMDLITWEVLFFNDFFDMGIQQSAVYLNNIYKSSVNMIFEFIQRNFINKNFDYFSISLMIIVNYEQEKIMNELKLNHLEYYFFEISKLLWVKFDQIFKSTVDQIFKSANRSTKILNNGIHPVTNKVGELLSMINLISQRGQNTPMIIVKVREIQLQFNQFFSTIVENMKFSSNNEREEAIALFFINNLYYLLVKLNDFDTLKEENDVDSFDKVLNNKREMYLNLLMNRQFEDMNKILKKCVNKGEKGDVVFVKEAIADLTKSDLKSALNYFSSKYRSILTSVKKLINSNIFNQENAKITYTNFLNLLLSKYATFVDLVNETKNNDLLDNAVKVQNLMIEIDNITKSL